MSTLLEQAREVAAYRAQVADNKAQWKEITDAQDAEHLGFRQGKALLEKQLAIAESDLRAAAVAEWQLDTTQSKLLMPGITIRENTGATFDPDMATKWALEHRVALKLDEVAYRKLVLIGQAPGEITTEFTAAIAKDLDVVLAKVTA